MTAQELLHDLKTKGATISHRAGRLIVDAPKGMVSDEIAWELSAHKAELLGLLESAMLEKARMLLHSKGYIPLTSSVTGDEPFVILRNDKVQLPQKWQGAVAYTFQELLQLRGLDEQSIRDIHEVKKLFGGKVTESKEPVSNESEAIT